MKRRSLFCFLTAAFLSLGMIFMQFSACVAEYEYKSKGKRDPFIPLVTGDIVTSLGLESVTSIDDIEFEGVIYDPAGQSMALLNGEVVKKGDKIYSVEILEISRSSIAVKIYDKAYTIDLVEEGGETVED